MTFEEINRLELEADLESLLSYFGVRTQKRNGTLYFQCQHPNHDDEHPSASVTTKNKIHCFACGETYDAVDVIRFKTGKNIKEAAEWLYEFEGRPAWCTPPGQKKKKKREKQNFFLTPQEAALIGVHIPQAVDVPLRYTEHREYLSADMPDGTSYDPTECVQTGHGQAGQVWEPAYLLRERKPVRISDFATERQYAWIAAQKAAEKLEMPCLSPEERKQVEAVQEKAKAFLKKTRKRNLKKAS